MLVKNRKRKNVLKIVLILGIILTIQLCSYMKYEVEGASKSTSQVSSSKKKVKKLKIVMPDGPYTYTGKKRNAEVKVYDGKTKLKNNKDYKLKYKNNVNTGKASVTITGKGKYTGSVTKYYYIAPGKPSLKNVYFNAKSTQAEISWKRDKKASGYAIYMSTKKNGKYEKIKVIKNNKTTSYKKTGLKSSKTYYFKIRSFVVVDGERIYGKKYSTIKSDTGLLSKVTLNYAGSGSNRNYNMKRASAKIKGTVIKPGKQFNWFNVVGPASKAKGYKKAGVIVNGRTTQGYGGGVCQVSTTIYQAAQKAKLKIVERHKHSAGVPYTKKGKDATVSYGSKNLRIKNNKSYPIKIVTYTKKTKTICEMYRII